MLDVRGQVAREGGEQDAALRQRSGQVAGAVHGGHRLARAGAAEHPQRPVPVALHQPPLGGMQEHAPPHERRVQHGLEFHFVRYDGEPHLRLRTSQRGGEVVYVHRWRRFALAHQVFVGVAGEVEEQRVVRFLGQALFDGLQAIRIGDAPHFRQHRLRHAEAHQLAVLQAGKGACGFRSCRQRFGRAVVLGQVHLHGAGFRVDVAAAARRPVVGVVVLVRPQQHVDIATGRLQHDGAIAAVDAQRAHVGILRAVDALVVQAAGGGIVVEPRNERPHAPLLLARQAGEGGEEVHGHSHVVGHDRRSVSSGQSRA